jgi:hypothetical protein
VAPHGSGKQSAERGYRGAEQRACAVSRPARAEGEVGLVARWEQQWAESGAVGPSALYSFSFYLFFLFASFLSLV